MNKEIDANPQECDLVGKAIRDVLIRDVKLDKFTERVLWAALALTSLIRHYGPDQIPESMPMTEYARHNQRHQQELIDTGRLSTRALNEIVNDLTGVKRMAFTFVGTNKETGRKTILELCPFDYIIKESTPITIGYLAPSQSYKKYLNDHNDVTAWLIPPIAPLYR